MLHLLSMLSLENLALPFTLAREALATFWSNDVWIFACWATTQPAFSISSSSSP